MWESGHSDHLPDVCSKYSPGVVFVPKGVVIVLYVSGDTFNMSKETRPDLDSFSIAVHLDTLKCHPSRF